MTADSPRIWLVDDEPDVLDALSLLIRSAEYTVVPCRSGGELLEAWEASRSSESSPGAAVASRWSF
ncbi:MAG: hypothetical protein MUE90_03670 [Thermoanaerobaculales bacterium]|nr:hypothetical protein [Thermoanaerobaculales bacterium]